MMTDEILGDMRMEKAFAPTIRLPGFGRLSDASKFLRRGGLSVISGAPGSSKSFFCLGLGLEISRHCPGVSWAYLGLESRRKMHLRRMAGVVCRSWLPVDDGDAGANLVASHTAELEELWPCVMPNPSLDEPTWEPTADLVAEFTRRAFASGTDVLFIDPLAAISTEPFRTAYEAEIYLTRELARAAAKHNAIAVLVVHTTKRREGRELTQGDVQGSTALIRLSDCVVGIDSHEPKTVPVWRPGGMRAEVTANRMVSILKTRHGSGSPPIAFRFGHDGPRFEEQGTIIPKSKWAD